MNGQVRFGICYHPSYMVYTSQYRLGHCVYALLDFGNENHTVIYGGAKEEFQVNQHSLNGDQGKTVAMVPGPRMCT